MRHKFIIICIGVAFSFVHYSCTSDKNLTIGNQFIQSPVSIISTDTATIKFSSFYKDSIPTSGNGIALIGGFADSNIGEVSSRSYIVMGEDEYSISTENKTVLDSFVLTLYPSGYYYGDTLVRDTIQVYRVLEEIRYVDPLDQSLYNCSRFKFDSISPPMGEKVYKPRPNTKSQVRVRINNDVAQELFEKFKSGETPFSSYGGFTRYFRGIVIKTKSSGSILGFIVDSTHLKMYYHTVGSETQEDDSLDIAVSNQQYQFNQIISDNKANTALIGEEPISSEYTGNCSYVQGSSGIFTRIDIPYIKNFFVDDRQYQIIKAELYIQPSTQMNTEYLPQKMNLYATNKFNDLSETPISDDITQQSAGTLYQDDIYKENTYYMWTITSYIKELVNSYSLDKKAIIVAPEDYKSKFDHLIIADPKKSKYRTKLKLYVIYYE